MNTLYVKQWERTSVDSGYVAFEIHPYSKDGEKERPYWQAIKWVNISAHYGDRVIPSGDRDVPVAEHPEPASGYVVEPLSVADNTADLAHKNVQAQLRWTDLDFTQRRRQRFCSARAGTSREHNKPV